MTLFHSTFHTAYLLQHIPSTGYTFTQIYNIRYCLKVSKPIFSRLIVILIVYEQISSLANSIRTLANMEDPIGRVLKKTEVTN